MLQIKNTVKLVAFELENGDYRLNGEARVTDDNAIQQINGTIYKDGVYAGNFSTHNADGELKYSLSAVSADNLASVAELVNPIAASLTAQFQ
ncbi:MAG: hypothetical protein U0L45_00055 [Alistipes sp.]|jgi:hypothetical protein|nr:hypothetical protein [Alistipes sp.]